MSSPGLAIFGIDTSYMTNEEVADIIRLLTTELNKRKNKIVGSNWLDTQLKAAALEARSWTKQHKRNMQECFR